MKSTNASDRCRNYDVLDHFTASRKMLYVPVNDWENIDAVLEHEGTEKQCGIARIFAAAGNFGNKPVVELPKEPIDFMHHLAALMGKAAAVIVRFRNANKYWKIDRKLDEDQKMLRGKPHNFYKLPINLLRDV